MQMLPVSGFPTIEPGEADPETEELFQQVQQATNLPYVPNWAKMVAVSPASLTIYLQMYRAFTDNISLPQSLVPMILYTVAEARNCEYCSSTNALYCRTLGVTDETLEMLARDLDNVSPKRLRIIIQFAKQCAFDPKSLTAADYDRVREEGISDDEIAQIIFLAALANFNDTLADSFKIKVDSYVLDALSHNNH